MKLLLLPLHPDLASSRLRIVELAPYLEALGAQCTVVPYPARGAERRALWRQMNAFDAVVVQKRLPTLGESRRWRAIGPPLVFDFDDALPYRQRPRRGRHESSVRRRRFERAMQAADAFACGSAALSELVATTDKPIAVLPTPVPVDVPLRAPGEHSGRPVSIGWIGGHGNLADLDGLRDVLADVARELDVEVVVISDTPWEAPGFRTRHVPWSLSGQAAALAELDVGLMPLADTPWNRGKCAYKLLQYMAAGVCAIGSPVGMNKDLIASGENGLLAADGPAWVGALRTACSDADLRDRLGAAGRATVTTSYSFERVATDWMRFLGGLLQGRSASAE